MISRKFLESWWSWLLFVAFTCFVGFRRNWDTLSLCLIAGFALTGLFRLLSAGLRSGGLRRFWARNMARSLAALPEPERAAKVRELPEEYRELVLEEMRRPRS